MIHSILIDDEKHCLDTLQKDLQRFCPQVNVLDRFQEPEKAVEFIKKHDLQLIFLDIKMPSMSGFQLLEKLHPVAFGVIFTTAYNEFAIEALRMNAVDFLEKPIDKDDLIKSIARFEIKAPNFLTVSNLKILGNNFMAQGRPKRIALPNTDGYQFILVEEILYGKANGNYTELVLKNGQKILVTRSMKDLEHQLRNYSFHRIHHSYLANTDHVHQFHRGDGGEVEMLNGDKLPVARSQKVGFLERFRG